MFTALLIAAPAGPPLDPALVESLRGAWGGAATDWLAPGEAAQFEMSQIPANRWEVWESCQAMGVDLCVLPTDGRRKALLLADMDSTMIGQECIDELAEEVGAGEKVRAITARAMDGQIDFEGALRERVALLEGLELSVIDQVLERRITLAPGGPVLLATMKAAGAHAALVSGGFTDFTGPVAARLGFDEHRANTLLREDGRLTGAVGTPILGKAAKQEALEALTQRLGLSADDVIAVGDGANDLAMLHAAGMGVALHAKPSVAAECDLRINHGDLTALLYLQGYRRDAFVTSA